MNFELLIASILTAVILRNVGDWFIYQIKDSPKQAMVTPPGWWIGFFAFALVLYFFLNGQTFFV